MPRQKLLSLSVPLPPLAEQRRIAATLKDQMAAVDRARVAAEGQLEAAKRLPAAYLRAVFDSPDAKKWPRRPVRELCAEIDYGFTASAAVNIKQPKLLRITDIQDGSVDWSAVPGCVAAPSDEDKYGLADGDIVFARTGV